MVVRHLDTARQVVIGLRVRRLFCHNSDCGKPSPVPQLAARHARRTLILQRALCAVALALGGRAGARLTRHLAATVSRMTLLCQIRALPDPQPTATAHVYTLAEAECARDPCGPAR
ncbi:hypothetical protein [Nocardia pneumoniae]|uniref:hypothetical protein n=1 Tax=Nocardia pneumoniae TaxID=228601 RepID=UPI0002D82EB1|nr:hypothetical protein [Nocardia pneumoniae]